MVGVRGAAGVSSEAGVSSGRHEKRRPSLDGTTAGKVAQMLAAFQRSGDDGDEAATALCSDDGASPASQRSEQNVYYA